MIYVKNELLPQRRQRRSHGQSFADLAWKQNGTIADISFIAAAVGQGDTALRPQRLQGRQGCAAQRGIPPEEERRHTERVTSWPISRLLLREQNGLDLYSKAVGFDGSRIRVTTSGSFGLIEKYEVGGKSSSARARRSRYRQRYAVPIAETLRCMAQSEMKLKSIQADKNSKMIMVVTTCRR